MIIQKIKIHHFGKLKDFSLSFENGMNVVFGENEAGKSTVMAFIKAMLYGFSGNKRSISENERMKYMPWDGSKMSGELYFECSLTKHGCIRRSFGKTARGDICKVIDDITGEELPLSAEEILEMNADTFCKTAFVKQLGSGISGKADDEIAKKMMNLEQSADEGISYSKTKECLLAQKRTLKTIGNKGKLSVLEAELIQLQEQAAQAAKREERAAELQETKNSLTEEKKNIETKLARVKQLAWQADCYKIQELHQKWKENQAKIDRIEHMPDYGQLEQDRKRKSELLNRLQSAKNEISELNTQKKVYEEQRPKLLEDVRERIEQLRSEQNNLRNKLMLEKKHTMFLLLSILLMATGILAGYFFHPIFFCILVVGLGLLLWYGCKSKAQLKRKETLEKEISELFSKIKVTNFEEYDKILNEYTEIKLKLQLIDEQLALKKEQSKSAEREIERFQAELSQRYGRSEAFDLLDQFKQEQEMLDKLLSESGLIRKAIEMVADGRPVDSFLEEQVPKPVEMPEESEQLKKRSMELIREIADCEHAIKEIGKEKPLSLIQSDIAARQEELKGYRHLYQALETAEAEIDEAYRVLENDFRPRLNAQAGEYFRQITGGCYDTVRVSKDFKVLLECGNELRELDYMSGGTADQFYLALRAAFLNMMESNEKIPFFLDDTLIQFDAKRTKNAFAFLINLNTQILYFTCKEDILALARQNSIHCMEVLHEHSL